MMAKITCDSYDKEKCQEYAIKRGFSKGHTCYKGVYDYDEEGFLITYKSGKQFFHCNRIRRDAIWEMNSFINLMREILDDKS